jgi:hypothetical protein
MPPIDGSIRKSILNFRFADTGVGPVGPDFVQMRPRVRYDLVRYMPEALRWEISDEGGGAA